MVAALCFALVPLASGCGFTIVQGNPRPNVALNPSTDTLAFGLSPTILDEFDVPTTNGIMGGHVSGWHGSLRHGFANGFGDAFRIVGAPTDAATVLTLDMVELEYVPAAVAANGAVVAANAQIRFKATLTDKGGEGRRVAGTAVSKKSTTDRGEAGNIAMSAIESMYEAIAAKLFASASASAEPVTD